MSTDRRRWMMGRVIAFAAAALLSGCGGGGGASVPATGNPKTSTQSAKVTIEIPSASSAAAERTVSSRRSALGVSYIPAGGTKASVFVDNVTVLNKVAVGASYSFNTNVGTHNFTLTYYDNGGNALSTGTQSANVVLPGPTTVSIPLGGIVKTIAFTGTLPKITINTALVNGPLAVTAKDADGNTITGPTPYNSPINISVSSPGYSGNAQGEVGLSINAGVPGASQIIAKPTDTITLNYAPGNAQLSHCVLVTASSAGATTAVSGSLVNGAGAATLTPTVTKQAFSRVVLSWTAFAGATQYRVYRGIAPGQETSFITAVNAPAVTATDWYAYGGPSYYYRVSAIKTGTEYCDNAAEPTGTATSDPTQLGAMIVWLDASDSSTITSANPSHSPVQTGDNVFGWGDKSGGGNNATSTGAAQPTWVNNGINGLPSMNGNGTTQYWNPLAASLTTNGQYSIFTLASFQNGLETPYDSFHRAPSLTIDPANNALIDGSPSGPTLTALPYILSHIGATAANVLTSSLYLNGTTPAAVNNYTVMGGGLPSGFQPDLPPLDGSTQFNLWYFSTPVGPPYNSFTNGQYFKGSMAEIIGYSVPLSTANQQIIEGYLACKWGLQASLPAAHPYAAGKGCPP